MGEDLLPQVYRDRPLHDDWAITFLPRWMSPWSYIPRRWTGLALLMPPRKVAGTAEEAWIPIQPGYPLAPDAVLSEDGKMVLGIHPVHSPGKWSIQSFYSAKFGKRIPCYFSYSKMLFGRRFHFNGPVKPDMTKGDWFWWVECSLTWTKPRT